MHLTRTFSMFTFIVAIAVIFQLYGSPFAIFNRCSCSQESVIKVNLTGNNLTISYIMSLIMYTMLTHFLMSKA